MVRAELFSIQNIRTGGLQYITLASKRLLRANGQWLERTTDHSFSLLKANDCLRRLRGTSDHSFSVLKANDFLRRLRGTSDHSFSLVKANDCLVWIGTTSGHSVPLHENADHLRLQIGRASC